jgi:hypothetical protein
MNSYKQQIDTGNIHTDSFQNELEIGRGFYYKVLTGGERLRSDTHVNVGAVF